MSGLVSAWGSRALEAISCSLLLVCHSAALNTGRQIPANTRSPGDRKQLGQLFFFHENQPTIPGAQNLGV